jgi:2-polyprenyl-3-methyl-5-hydroxy-6-metoxy-1,4-benzoquinol methylase
MISQAQQPVLDNTGERLIPDAEDGSLNHQVHQSRYEYARRLLPAGGDVLDYGCGTGYGLHYLAGFTTGRCVGVDKEEGVRYAAQRYPAANVEHLAADVTQPSARFGKFDLIVSFDVIEHVDNIDAYLANIAEQLREDHSVALLSTPWSYRRQNLLPAHNPYHLCEMTTAEFFARLDPYFTIDEIFHTLGMVARVRRKGGKPNHLPGMSVALAGVHLIALEEAIEELSRQVEALNSYPVAAQAVSRRLRSVQPRERPATSTYTVQGRTYRVRQLQPHIPVYGRFVADSVNLSAVDVALALYEPVSGSELTFTLYCNQQIVAQVTQPALLLREDLPQRFLFAPLAGAAGQEFHWELATPAAAWDGAVGVWSDDQGQPLFQESYRRYRWVGAPHYNTTTEWIISHERPWLADWPALWPQQQIEVANSSSQFRRVRRIELPPTDQRPWPPETAPLTKFWLALRHYGFRATIDEALHYLRWRFSRSVD